MTKYILIQSLAYKCEIMEETSSSIEKCKLAVPTAIKLANEKKKWK